MYFQRQAKLPLIEMFLFTTGAFKLFVNLCEPDVSFTPSPPNKCKILTFYDSAEFITYIPFFIFALCKLIPKLKISLQCFLSFVLLLYNFNV